MLCHDEKCSFPHTVEVACCSPAEWKQESRDERCYFCGGMFAEMFDWEESECSDQANNDIAEPRGSGRRANVSSRIRPLIDFFEQFQKKN